MLFIPGVSDPSEYYIEFEYKYYDTEEKMRQYLKDPLYSKDGDHPGICFGFAIENKT